MGWGGRSGGWGEDGGGQGEGRGGTGAGHESVAVDFHDEGGLRGRDGIEWSVWLMSLSMVLASLYSRRDARKFRIGSVFPRSVSSSALARRRVGRFEVCLTNQKARIQRQS